LLGCAGYGDLAEYFYLADGEWAVRGSMDFKVDLRKGR